MVNFKCGEKTCTISFPLTEKTNEKMIKCPLEVNLMTISSKKNMCQLFVYTFLKILFSFLQDCGAETNIWKCLKRIVELKQDHLTARKEAEKKVLRTAIHFLTDIIAELETIVDRYVYISL